MISKIDSIEISMNKANIRDLDVLKKVDKSTYKKAYIQKVIDRNERLFIVIHNDYDTSKETYKLEYFFTQLDYILNDLGIVDQSQVRLNRVDYCFDYKVDTFESMYKQNNILVLLYALEINADLLNIIETNTILDQQKTSLQAYNRGNTKQLYVYDKEKQSPKHPFSTRQEIRCKRLNVELTRENILEVVKGNIDVLSRLEGYFKQMEEQKIQYLYELYLKEYEKKQVHSLTSFITRYQEQIGTRYVCKELYKATGHIGKFENWLKEYRKKVDIKFVSKTDTKHMLADMRKSIKSYLGSDTTLFLYKKIEPPGATLNVFIMCFGLSEVKCECLC